MATAKRQGWALGLIGCGLAYSLGSLLFLVFMDRGSVITLMLGLLALVVGLLDAKR